ncbi:hypothetical protein ABYH20_005560, partial [Acinetobacter baumannii]
MIFSDSQSLFIFDSINSDAAKAQAQFSKNDNKIIKSDVRNFVKVRSREFRLYFHQKFDGALRRFSISLRNLSTL